METQNKNLTIHTENDKFKKSTDRFILFIKLIRKYSKKLKGIMDLIKKYDDTLKYEINHNKKIIGSISETSKENLIKDLLNTIEKLNSTIYNQQLIDNLFEYEDKKNDELIKRLLEETDKKENEIRLKNANLIAIIENMEIQIKKLNEQNENIAIKRNNEVKNKNFLLDFFLVTPTSRKI